MFSRCLPSFFCFFQVLFLAVSAGAQTDLRSDSLDITHCDLQLTVRNLAAKTISGEALIHFTAKQNSISRLRLDLLKLPVSDISISGVSQPFTHNDSEVFVTLLQPRNTGDTFSLRVVYSGQPVTDPKWGGFYFSNGYAFNMGVGFVLNPHNFGRCWFPCFDNFVERATYAVHVNTDSGYTAVCGGLLQGTTTNPDNSVTWHWNLGTEVPSYLVSVSVSTYAFVQYSYAGVNRNIPVMLAAHAADTVKLKNSFIHLPDAIGTFENRYGPYRFERVGYNLVPFASGAMEHACNISYPLSAADGTTASETLFAHELSHHWWGDLATCSTAGDMWLNEGWASYSEKVFLESLYGRSAYLDEVRSNHLNVLRFAHIIDGDFRAITGIPHQYTYGEHVYHKGADAVHTLRSYMGDSAFFAACRSYLNQHTLRSVNTAVLKSHFQQFTPLNLDHFFSNWISSPGFCDFRIRSIHSDASFNTTVIVQQELRAAPAYFSEVPLTITFYSASWEPFTKSFSMSGASTELRVALPFAPVFAVIDRDEQISFARSQNTVVIKSTGLKQLDDALMGVTVNSVTDSALLHVEHHWTRPDQSMCNIPGVYLSNYRYWKVDGIWPAGFAATAFLNYDGSTPSNLTSGYLDHTFIKQTEDSLVLLWRPDGESNWQLVPDSIAGRTMGASKTDKVGRFWLKKLQKGEYAMGMYDQALAGIAKQAGIDKQLTVYPNPSKDLVRISVGFAHHDASVTIYDLAGKIVMQVPCSSLLHALDLDVSQLPKGAYTLQFSDGTHRISKKLLLQ